MDMEEHISNPIHKSQNHHEMHVTMAFYSEKEQLYLET